METRIIETEEEKQKVELLRKEVFHLPESSSYFIDQLMNNKIHAIVAIDNNEIVASVYFHRFANNLMIDKVFVKEEYQNKGLKLGRGLIMQLIASKASLEVLLGGPLEMCRIESENSKSHALYIKIGFHEGKMDEDSMYRHL